MLLMLEKLFSSNGAEAGAACQCMGELRLEVVSLDGVLRLEQTYKMFGTLFRALINGFILFMTIV